MKRGNVVDMAVGVVVGGAFSKIVTSLVGDIVTPLIGLITGGTSLSDLKVVLTEAETAADGTVITPENAVTYGAFIQNIIDFLLIAFSIFTVIRIFGMLRRKAEEARNLLLKKEGVDTDAQEAAAEEAAAEADAEPEMSSTDKLLIEIRDLLKENKTAEEDNAQ